MADDAGSHYHLSGHLTVHRLGPHLHPCQVAEASRKQILVISVSVIICRHLSWAGNIPATHALLDRRDLLDPSAGVGVEEDDSLRLFEVCFQPASTASEGPNDMLEGPTLQMIGRGLHVHIFFTIS